MTTPIESVARIAQTPAQAKIFVASLMAAGIPARVEGDSLADEYAASRRLLNLMGTRVMVPTQSLERAREILQPVAIDPEELARQALEAAPVDATAPGTALAIGNAEHTRWPWPLLILLPLLGLLLYALLR